MASVQDEPLAQLTELLQNRLAGSDFERAKALIADIVGASSDSYDSRSLPHGELARDSAISRYYREQLRELGMDAPTVRGLPASSLGPAFEAMRSAPRRAPQPTSAEQKAFAERFPSVARIRVV